MLILHLACPSKSRLNTPVLYANEFLLLQCPIPFTKIEVSWAYCRAGYSKRLKRSIDWGLSPTEACQTRFIAYFFSMDVAFEFVRGFKDSVCSEHMEGLGLRALKVCKLFENNFINYSTIFWGRGGGFWRPHCYVFLEIINPIMAPHRLVCIFPTWDSNYYIFVSVYALYSAHVTPELSL